MIGGATGGIGSESAKPLRGEGALSVLTDQDADTAAGAMMQTPNSEVQSVLASEHGVYKGAHLGEPGATRDSGGIMCSPALAAVTVTMQ